MDLLLWHKRVKERFSENKERLWDSSFIYEGKVCRHPSRELFYTGKYLLDTKEVKINDGDIVGILKSEPNKFAKDNLTEFVRRSNYIILKCAENLHS